MRIVRPLLLLVLLAGLAGGGYLFWAKKRASSGPAMSSSMSSSAEGSDQSDGFQIGGFHLPSFKGDVKVAKPDLAQVSEQAQTQLEQLKDKSLEVKEHVGVVLGEAQEASGESTLQQRALEYGQYLYCKGVVEEWEKTEK